MKSVYEAAQKAALKRQEEGKPVYEHNLIKRYGLDTDSRKEAIFMKCFECEGGDKDNLPDPGFKKAIGNCTITDCPLWKWRPYQSIKK